MGRVSVVNNLRKHWPSIFRLSLLSAIILLTADGGLFNSRSNTLYVNAMRIRRPEVPFKLRKYVMKQDSPKTNYNYDNIVEVIHSSSQGNANEQDFKIHIRRGRRLQQTFPYCLAIPTADQVALQNALDWACGPSGGVNCAPLQVGGVCYDPNDLYHHASYAFNEYYVSMNGATGSCNFNGVANTSSTSLSSGSCTYPALGSTTSNSPSPTSSTPYSNSTITGTPSSSPTKSTCNLKYILSSFVVGVLLVHMKM